jgi:hypothetical protein
VLATFLGAEALQRTEVILGRIQERAVFSCDYNGWADVPEEEREGVEAFEALPPAPSAAPLVALIIPVLHPLSLVRQRKAA